MKAKDLIPKVREYRPKHWQVYFSYKGERFFLQKWADGRLLSSEEDAYLLSYQIDSLLKSDTFDIRDFLPSKFQFKLLVEVWLSSSTCSPDYLKKRTNIANNNFLPHFGDMDVRKITDSDIQKFFRTLSTKGKKTQKNYLAELKTFFNFIFQDGIIPRIPRFPKVGRIPEPSHNWIDAETQDKIYSHIRDIDKPILTFLRWTGCRPNEARGLQKSDIDFANGQIHIQHALSMSGNLKETKTGKLRILPIIPEIEEYLKGNGHDTFVFSRNGRVYSRRMLEKAWKKAVKLSGIPYIPLYQGTKHSLCTQRVKRLSSF